MERAEHTHFGAFCLFNNYSYNILNRGLDTALPERSTVQVYERDEHPLYSTTTIDNCKS